MATMLLLMSALLGLLTAASAHTYHLGSCRTIEPVEDFDMDRFLGRWYVLQKTSTNVRCLTNEYSVPEGSPAKLVQTFMLGIPGVNHMVHYTGELKTPNPIRPAAMDVKFPLNLAGHASYTVFMTDYDTYAAVYTCQTLALWYRHSASILSRTPTLDASVIDQVRNRLRQAGVDPRKMKTIRQNCPAASDDGVHVHIRPNVFKATNLTDALNEARETINGVADVAQTVYEVYNTVNAVAVVANRKRRDIQGEDDEDVPLDWLP